MKYLLLLAPLTLAACTPGGLTSVPTTPAAVADQTVLDEKGAIAAETAYTIAARGAALAIRTGAVSDPAIIQRIGQLDRQAYSAVQATRAAYEAGNAASYKAAFDQAMAGARAISAAF